MGSAWGGSNTITNVSTSISRLVPDEVLPNIPQVALIKKLKGSKLPLHEEIKKLSLNSITPKINQLYGYAKSNYFYGLPETVIKDSSVLPMNLITGIIQNEVAKKLGHTDIKIVYAKVGGINSLHYGWFKLFNDFKYNVDTNKITYLNKQYKFKDIQCIYNKDSYLNADKDITDKIGIYPSARYYRGTNNKFIGFMPDIVGEECTNSIRIHYEDKRVAKYFDIPMMDNVMDEDYFQVMYEYVHPQLNYIDDSGITQGTRMFNVWTYKDNSGVYPKLDLYQKQEFKGLGTFLPLIYLRQDKRNLTDSALKETQPYITSKKCIELLGLNYDDLSESLHKNDMSDVYEVFVMAGVPLNSTNSLDIKYLYKHFEKLDAYFIEDRDSEFHIVKRIFNNYKYLVNIRDRKNGIRSSFTTIFKRYGRFGAKPETYTRYKETLTYSGSGWYPMNEDGEIPSISVEADVFRRQISELEYEELVVIGAGASYEVISGEWTYYGSKSKQALIPLDMDLMSQFNLQEKECLYARSLHLVINYYIETKLDWWQTGVFQVFMFVIAIAITWFYPPLSAAAWSAVLAMSVGAQITIVLLITAAQSFLVPEVFKVVVDLVGVEIAMVAAIAAIAYGGYSVLAETKTYTTDLILKLGSQLFAKANEIKLHNTLESLYDEYGEFNLLMEKKVDALNEIQKELNMPTTIPLLEASGLVPLTVLGESPSDYLARTSYVDLAEHQQSLISNFVEITTRLRT